MYNPLGTEQDLPWSLSLEKEVKKTLGNEFEHLLPLLWDNYGDPAITAKVRYAYMDCVTHLVEEAFSKQIGDWCRNHGVEYIGYVIEDNNQHARTGTGLGHFFRGLKWQSMAGIDNIGGQVYPGGEDRRKSQCPEQCGECIYYCIVFLYTAGADDHSDDYIVCIQAG